MPRTEIHDGTLPYTGTHPKIFEYDCRRYLGVFVGIERRAFPTALIPDDDLHRIENGQVEKVTVFIDGVRTVGMRVPEGSEIR